MSVTWGQFAEREPELAALGEGQFARTGLELVGTLRRDGWPRISPVEPFIVDGNLYLGMMWRSRKALDLLRDPRCVVHSTVVDRKGSEGEFKVYGRAVEITDLMSGVGSVMPYLRRSGSGPKSPSSTASPSPSKALRSPNSVTIKCITRSGSLISAMAGEARLVGEAGALYRGKPT